MERYRTAEREFLVVRIIVNIGHPAHVHFFKHFIWKMRARGHDILISTVDKDVTCRLLEAYDFDYDLWGARGSSMYDFAKEVVKRDYHVYKLVRRFKPDVILGIADIFGAHVSRVTKARSVVFTDTEHARLSNFITFPFADVVCTPTCFKKDLGKKQLRYDGYHELAYLHPNYFSPDPSVLWAVGLGPTDPFVVIRFVAWQAAHDRGHHGFDLNTKRRLVEEIEKYARVLITSEAPLPDEFERYRLMAPPERIHDLLYYATLYIGEGATVASECAVLGTPAIYVNTLQVGYLDEQEEKYGLVYNFLDPKRDQKEAVEKALELVRREDLKAEWRAKRERLLKDKVDVTEFIVDFVENCPRSFCRSKKQGSWRVGG